MFYKLDHALQEMAFEQYDEDDFRIGICTSKEFASLIQNEITLHISAWESFTSKPSTHRFTNTLDAYNGYCFGNVDHMYEAQGDIQTDKMGLYITNKMFVIICDTPAFEHRLFDAFDKLRGQNRCLEHLISTFMDTLLYDSRMFIAALEQTLEALDDALMESDGEGIVAKTMAVRKHILRLTHYYEELMNVYEVLLEDENNFFHETQLHHIRIVYDRSQRMLEDVRLLRDYAVQIREAYQSQMDLTLNQIMYVFTVVTVIFLPLTLIVGWYGMNFTNMPELSWRYGYVFVITLSIVVVGFCFWYFYKKKLLKK